MVLSELPISRPIQIETCGSDAKWVTVWDPEDKTCVKHMWATTCHIPHVLTLAFWQPALVITLNMWNRGPAGRKHVVSSWPSSSSEVGYTWLIWQGRCNAAAASAISTIALLCTTANLILCAVCTLFRHASVSSTYPCQSVGPLVGPWYFWILKA